ncbi:MAG: hypothetical protein EAX81_06820 [Candidatus Thorarchaeota archaeon]|nr:hypothetical protein [Candidatus Thorarchaeota archaeon]
MILFVLFIWYVQMKRCKPLLRALQARLGALAVTALLVVLYTMYLTTLRDPSYPPSYKWSMTPEAILRLISPGLVFAILIAADCVIAFLRMKETSF